WVQFPIPFRSFGHIDAISQHAAQTQYEAGSACPFVVSADRRPGCVLTSLYLLPINPRSDGYFGVAEGIFPAILNNCVSLAAPLSSELPHWGSAFRQAMSFAMGGLRCQSSR